MKKHVIALLLMSLILSLSACSSDTVAFEESTDATVSTTTPTQPQVSKVPETTSPTIQQSVLPEVPTLFDIANYHYMLTKLGSFTTKDDLVFSDQLPLLLTNDENDNRVYTLLSHLGEDKMEKKYSNYDYFGDGITAAYLKGTNVPSCSLINIETGEVYLDDGAVQIEPINERFYYVIYVTEKTEDQNEAFIYFTDRMLSLAPEDGDVLYKGYAKIFDLNKGSFVGDFQTQVSKNRIHALENTLGIAWEHDNYNLYLDDGTVLTDIAGLYFGSDGIIQKANSNTTVFSADMVELYTVTDAAPMSLFGKSNVYSTRYFRTTDDYSHKGVVDCNGTVIVPNEYETISLHFDHYFVVEDSNDKYGIYQPDGTLIVPVEYDHIYPCDFPAFQMIIEHEGTDDEEYLFLPGIGQICVSDYSGYDPLYYLGVEDSYRDRNYLVYETGETMLVKDYEEVVGAIVASDNGILEMFHGTTLIEEDYSKVVGTEEYIYAYKDGMWTVYSWELVTG